MDSELPLEAQARLASLSHEIKELNLRELQELFMQLAHQKARQEQLYATMLSQATKSELDCYRKLEQVEKACEEYRAVLKSPQ